ncbi:hypothetical protein D3C87_1837770 [compost metagenome]
MSPVIQKEYQEAMVGTVSAASMARGLTPSNITPGAPATAVIKPYFSGGGVLFRADPTASTAVKNKVNDLNKSVAPIVNKLIRMDAHLGGDTNYKSSYDRNFKTIFGFDQKDLEPKATNDNAE